MVQEELQCLRRLGKLSYLSGLHTKHSPLPMVDQLCTAAFAVAPEIQVFSAVCNHAGFKLRGWSRFRQSGLRKWLVEAGLGQIQSNLRFSSLRIPL